MATTPNKIDPINPAVTATAPTGVENDRLATIKLAILNGTYLTDARIDGACDALSRKLVKPVKKAAAETVCAC
jgi:anti-sigma28 factor (negative regulator of flagellin synthesis)